MPPSLGPSDAVTQYDYCSSDGDGDKHDQQCPHCETCFHSEERDRTTVIDQDGYSYNSIEETDPTDGPYFCPPCWAELETARLARAAPDSNHPLADE